MARDFLAQVDPLSSKEAAGGGYGIFPVFDNKGRIFSADNFAPNNLSNWNMQLIGGGTSARAIDNTFSFSPPNCVKFTTDATLFRGIGSFRNIPVPFSGRMGLEVKWSAVNTGSLTNTEIFLTFVDNREVFYGDGVRTYTFKISFDGTQIGTVSIDTPAGTVNVDTPVRINKNALTWHAMKMIIDLSNDSYVKGYLDDHEYDLSAYKSNRSANASDGSGRWLFVAYSIRTLSAAVKTFNFDDILVTFGDRP